MDALEIGPEADEAGAGVHRAEPGKPVAEPGRLMPEPGPAGEARAPDVGEAREATGEPRVDAALARLDELAGRPVTEHREVFDDVHQRLREVLGELDTRHPQARGAGAEGRTAR